MGQPPLPPPPPPTPMSTPPPASPPANPAGSPRLHRHTAGRVRSWPDLLKVWGPVGVLGLVAFIVAWQFVEPAPPSNVRLATGPPGGAYERMGQRYAASFVRNGIDVQPVATAGSLDNWAKLAAGEVDAAIVQGGTAPANAAATMQAVVSVAYEPLFVFYRDDATAPPTPDSHTTNGNGNIGSADNASATRTTGALPVLDRIDALAGKRIAIGAQGSGTRALVLTLLREVGLDATVKETGTTLLAMTGTEAADALLAGRIDAACFVMSPEAPLVQRLLAAEGVGLLDFARAPAFAHRLPYLSAVTLYQGVVDPVADLPPRDVRLVAPAAFLAVRKDTHRAIVQLLVEAARADRTPSMVTLPGTFPSLQHCDLPVADEAEFFFKRGPSFLYRRLPFAAASLIDRLAILTIPLLTILIPLMRAAPPALRWSVRRRIYRWYRQLRVIDEELSLGDTPHARLDSDLDQLNRLDNEVAETDVPLSYMEEFYNLRLHIAYMRGRVEQRLSPKK